MNHAVTRRIFLTVGLFCGLLSIALAHATSPFDHLFQRVEAHLKSELDATYQAKFSGKSLFVMPCNVAPDVLGGRVFGDFDYDGTDNFGTGTSVGIRGVTVYLFGCMAASGNSVLLDSMLTDENGAYAFTGLTGTSYRVEFLAPDYLTYFNGPLGPDNGTQVQFATPGSCDVNASYTHPHDYCAEGENAPVVATCFVNGDPLADGAEQVGEDVFVGFPWSASGSTPPDHLATAEQTGAVYGIAYDRATETVYLSAFAKRHVGLGPLGAGGIYSYQTNSGTLAQVANLETLGIDVGNILSNSQRGLATDLAGPSNDADIYQKILTQSLGELAFRPDDGHLYAVNLFNKTLVRIDPTTATSATEITIPDPTCTNGAWRPFALTYHRGDLYVGGVCDASAGGTETDLHAYVYRWTDGAFDPTPVLDFPLDYPRGYVANSGGANGTSCEDETGWYPWLTGTNIPAVCNPGSNSEFLIYPQPALTDLVFDADGSMILGLMDRVGHQFGFRNYPLTGTSPLISGISGGDVLRAMPSTTNSATWILESNATSGGITTAGANNGQGPDGGEYYFEDLLVFLNGVPHAETSLGGLARNPGSGEVATSAFDPFGTSFNRGGVNWFSNLDGTSRDVGYVLYQSTTGANGSFGKANGMGDVMLACGGTAPTEVGGTVWTDDNTNGIQDACESGAAGVNVTLYDATGTMLHMVQTDADGHYAFNTNGVPGGTFQPGADYFLVFGENGQFNPMTGEFMTGRFVTLNDTGEYPRPDRNDSDATLAPGTGATDAFDPFPYIPISVGMAGMVDHSFDTGLTPTPMNQIANVGGTFFNDLDGDGLQNDGAGGWSGIDVVLADGANNPLDTVQTDLNGDYLFANLGAGDYVLTFFPQTNDAGVDLEVSPQDVGTDDTIDSDIDPLTNTFDLPGFDPNGGSVDVDAGGKEVTANLNGFVFNDANGNGTFDAGTENPIENVTVNLYDAADLNTVLASVPTDATGTYTFPDLASGTYVIGFDPAGNADGVPNYVFTQMDAGTDDTLDSDPDPQTGLTDPITFDATNNDLDNVDAGFVEPSAGISGYVFNDANENGLQDAGDTPLMGVTVQLIDVATNGVVQTTPSLANGTYNFPGVLLGTYVVAFDASTNTGGLTHPLGSPQDQGSDDTLDSDPDPDTGRTDPIAFDPQLGTMMNVDAGFFEQTAEVSGTVFVDIDQDGQQDPNEGGIEDLEIILIDSNGDTVAVVTSGPDGDYTFGDQPADDYTVVFDFNPTGNPDYEFTTPNQGDDTTDSDAVPVTGTTTATVTFSFDPTDPTTGDNDAGLTLPFGSVSGLAFVDADFDGLQNGPQDAPLGGVSVTLSGVTEAGDSFSSTVTTGPNGTYTFVSVPPGDYTLDFTAPNQLVPTLQNQGTDPTMDSDVNAQGEISFTLAGGESVGNLDGGFKDTTPPTFDQMPADQTASCSDGAVVMPVVTASDNFDTDVEVTVVVDTIAVMNGGANCDGIQIVRTWTATDDCGNATDLTQTVTLADQQSPIFSTAPADTTVFCPDLPLSDFKVIDDCDMDVDVTFTDVASGGCPNLITRTYTATDDCGNETTLTQTITQLDTVPPTVTFVNPDLIGLVDGDTLTFGCLDQMPLYGVDDAEATDDCSGIAEFTFEDLIVTDGDCVEDGFIRLMLCAWTAVDLCGNETSVTIYFLVDDNEAPVLNGAPPAGEITVDCFGVPDAPLVTATDNCTGNLPVDFSEVLLGDTCTGYKILRKWSAEDDCGNMTMTQQTINVDIDSLELTGVPDDLTVDCDAIPEPAEPTVTVDCFDADIEFTETLAGDTCVAYKIIRKWTATDACGRMDMDQQTITVEVPELMLTGVPDDLTIDCTQPVPAPADPQPSSNCYAVTVEFEEMENGEICDDYQIVRMWRATSSCGDEVVETQVITIEVPELELAVPDDLVLSCADVVPPFEEVPVDAVCFEITQTLTQDSLPGDCPQNYTLIRTWTLEDECGNTETASQEISVVDEEAPLPTFNDPIFTGLTSGDSVVLECTALPLLDENSITWTDNCGAVTTDFMEMTDVGDCPEDGYLIRMECCWKAEDECGNEAEFCLIIRIEDNLPPVFDQPAPPDLTVDLAQGEVVPDAPVLTASDACSGAASVVLQIDTTANDCGFTLSRVWTAEDDCGNAATETQTITVNDLCDCPAISVDGYEVVPADCGLTNGSITANVTVAPGVYEYALVPALGDQDGNVFTNLPPGNYLLVTNLPNADDCDEKFYFTIGEDCTDLLEVTIAGQETLTLTDFPGVIDFPGDPTSAAIAAAGNAAEVSATAISGTSVTLTPAPGFLGVANELITTVHCFDATTCDTTHLLVTVEQNACTLAATAETTPADCGAANGSIELTTTGSTGALTVGWLPDIGTATAYTDLAAGTYAYTLTDAATECSLTGTVAVEELAPAALNPGEIATSDGVCPGFSDASIVSSTTEVFDVFRDGIFVGATPLTNLSPGTYTVTKGNGLCATSLDVTLAGPDAWQVMPMYMNETCAGNNGVINLSVLGGTAPYTYAWSNGTTTNPLTSAAATETYAVTITDANGCTTMLVDLEVELDNTLIAAADVTNTTCAQNDGSIELGATGGTAPYTYAWSNSAETGNLLTGLAAGFTTDVTITDANGCVQVLENLTVADGCTDVDCASLFDLETLLVQAPTCDADADVCVPIRLTDALQLNVTANGVPVANLQGCDFDTTLNYSYNSLPTGGGGYTLDSWTVNGTALTGSFDDPAGLVDLMNQLDLTGTWTLNAAAELIEGGNPATDYGSILVTQPSDQATATLEPNTSLIPNGTQLTLAPGSYEVIFTDPNDGCADTLAVDVVCTTNEVLTRTIEVNQTAEFCPDSLDLNELTGAVDSYTWSCAGNCPELELLENAEGCLDYTGLQAGTAEMTLVVCDVNGICDATTVLVTVVEPLAPEASIDQLVVAENGTGTVDVLANDRVHGTLQRLSLPLQPEHGTATANPNGTITYTPAADYCGGDAFSYEICNSWACAETTVNVLVRCDAPTPVTGFSPNNDGVNDHFVIHGIEQYPNNVLRVYNRQGLQVYEQPNYDNSWTGRYRRTIDLPDGTYFWVLEYGDNQSTISGYVQVQR